MPYKPVSIKQNTGNGYQPVSGDSSLLNALDTRFPHRKMTRQTAGLPQLPKLSNNQQGGLASVRANMKARGQKVPFAATRTGVALNTVTGIPKELGKFGQGVARGVAATAATPATIKETFKASREAGEFTPAGPKFDPTRSKLSQLVFGDQEFSTFSEAADIQDMFRSEEDQGKFTKSTGLLAIGLAAADIPSFGTGSKIFKTIFKNLSKDVKVAKDVKNANDAVALLRKHGVSDDVIQRYNLASKVVKADTESKVAVVFREAATGEAQFKSALATKAKPQKKVSGVKATAAGTPTARQTPQTPETVTLKQADEAIPSPDAARQNLRQNVLDQADEARYVADEVLPQTDVPIEDVLTQRKTSNAIDTLQKFKGQPIKNIEIDELIRTDLTGQGELDPKRVAELVENIKDGKPTEPILVQVADGNIYIEDGKHRVAALAQLGEQTVDAIQIPTKKGAKITSRPALGDLPRLPRKPSQIDNPDAVIQAGLAKYKATVSPAKGDSAMARLAAKAPSLGAVRLVGELLTPISSRLGRINPVLKFKLRNFEFRTRTLTQERLEKVVPLMQATKQMSKEDQLALDLAQKNGDPAVLDAIAQKYGIQKEMTQARAVLDELFEEARKVGFEVDYRGDFFPRLVKNPFEFSQYLRGRDDWGEIRKAITEKAEEKGLRYTDLTDEEIASMANNLLRGYGSQLSLARPGQLKARKLEEIGPELNRFYENSNTALLTYIHKMTDEIEGRRFFGKEIRGEVVTKNPNTGTKVAFNTEDSIGAYVTRLLADGTITARQEEEVTKILQSRFKKGNMNGLVAAYRDLEYISTMGNPISAITQFGDLAFAVYKNGFYHSLRGAGSTILRKNQMTKESMGIERIAQEFDNPSKTSKALETTFKLVGMEQVDRLGKETFLEGSRTKLQSLAKKQDDDLVTDLYYMFDDVTAARTLEELRQGAVTVRTKEVHFNRLLDIQPIAKSEMPQKYLEAPNGRIFYMLKSFTLKQFDIFRREAIDKMVFGTPKERIQATQNLIRLSGIFMLANATTDEIKDFILGRETSLKDRTVDNIFRLFGASKYDVYNSRERGVGFAVLQRLLPPASFADRFGRDIYNITTDKTYKGGPLEGERYKSEVVQSFPGGGKLYYWWFGRGAQKEELEEEPIGALPKLPKLPKPDGGALPKLPKLPQL